MKNFDLFRLFAERILGRPLEQVQPHPMSGWQVVEALWPLNERFRPHAAKIKTLAYDSTFEKEADSAIELLVSDISSSWDSISAGAWRVLLERQQQAIIVALANEKAGNPVMPVPPGFSAAQRTVAAVLFLLHGMKLPWPAADRSGFEVPSGAARESFRIH
jgi:hypothetical protein